ncbi:Ppx/GppA phosphatase family protein [Chryseobacterium sp. T1]
MNLAAIDIGSNAARLLINSVEIVNGKAEFTKLNLLRIPLRLGIDVFTKGTIGKDRQEMFLGSMKIFSQLMDIYKVDHYRACATSAMRDAKNGKELIDLARQQANINIEIISGDEEATLIYENHVEEILDKKASYLYVDVGGGSTELTFYENGKMLYEKSFNIGTIRLLNNLVTEDMWYDMKSEIKKNIISKNNVVAIGSGGNINKIFSLSKTKDGKPMSAIMLKKYYKTMQQLSVADRMSQYQLREDRADVLVPALQIFNNVMNWADINHVYVPKISVADGLIKSIYQNLQTEKI